MTLWVKHTLLCKHENLSSNPAPTEKANSGGGPVEQWGADKSILKPEAFTWQPL